MNDALESITIHPTAKGAEHIKLMRTFHSFKGVMKEAKKWDALGHFFVIDCTGLDYRLTVWVYQEEIVE